MNKIQLVVAAAFTTTNIPVTDKLEAAASSWAAAIVAGDILAQSFAQVACERLIGHESTFTLLSAVGKGL